MMETCKNQPSKLFVCSSVDYRDEIEEKYERAYQYLIQVTANLTDKELHDSLSKLVCKDNQHEDISLGLLYKILTDAALAPITYRDLTLLTRDGLGYITTSVSALVAEKYGKLSDIARKQLLWLVREFVKNGVTNTETIVWNVLRQASGGDISPKNLFLVDNLLDILIDHRQWLEKYPVLVSSVIYSYVRLIEDHNGQMLATLRNKEVKFVISLIRERFNDVLPLGRDFVRLLQNVARIPEFEALWRDILNNPKQLMPSFQGVWQLLQIRTSRRFLTCRLTPDIERKLHFLANNVKFGNHKRYQDWFQDKYFATPESHSLRSDLIRFIINVIHPTNDMLCSDLIPRWAIIGWLLTSCTNSIASANAKLALFYDWLFFDPVKDNIMNVEPGILVMYNSIRNHPAVSATLLDFLCRIIKNFHPKSEDRIRAGVYNSLRQILEKQVIPNLPFLFESSRLDRDLRTMIRDNFREFCSGAPTDNNCLSGDMMNNSFTPSNDVNRLAPGGKMSYINHNSVINFNDNDKVHVRHDDGFDGSGSDEAHFSDDEDNVNMVEASNKNDETDDDDDLPLSKVRLKEKPLIDKIELPNSIAASFEKFTTAKTAASFEGFLNDFRSLTNLDSEQENYVHSTIISIIKPTIPPIKSGKMFPDSKSDEKQLADSISSLIFNIFKVMYQYEDKCKKCFNNMVKAVSVKYDCVGYLILYFLKVHTKLQTRKNPNGNISFKTGLYKTICDYLDNKLDECLANDLSLLEKESQTIFLWIVPDVYREFKTNMINNSSVMKVVIGCIDAKNLRDLIYNVTQGKLVMFKNDGILDCIRDSLQYETFEQFCIWQLVQAHDVPIEFLQDILPDLESSNHAEALTYMLLILKNEKPTNELIRLLLSRENKSRGDPFVTSALRYWCQGDFEEKLSEIIANLLSSKYPNSSPNKRKRPTKNTSAQNSSPTSDQLLSHLEHFRRSCRHGGIGTGLYAQDVMQRALQQAFSHSSDSLKKQYSDLFGLAAEDETSSVGRRGTSGRGRKPPPNKKETNNSSNSNSKKNSEPINNTVFSSDDESSDDNIQSDWSKSKPAKRRKKILSESD